jgi:hypothetical protein
MPTVAMRRAISASAFHSKLWQEVAVWQAACSHGRRKKANVTQTRAAQQGTQRFSLSVIGLLACAVLVLAANSGAQPHSPIAERVAKTFGLDNYEQIDAIRYTWSAEFPGVNVSHVWGWEPKTTKVTYEGKDKDGKPVKATYLRSELSSQTDAVKNQIDPSFINDNYWLLFPFHAYWDTSATVTTQGLRKLPLGVGSAELVTVKYPTEAGGYTPGDTWELYVGKDNRVEQFEYHRGGPRKPSLVITTWTGYKKAGPLLVSTEHRGTADGNPLHVSLTDVSVKLAGKDTWIKAE